MQLWRFFVDIKTPIYSTTTSDSTSLHEAGLFKIPEDILDDNMLYLITIFGGRNIDADDNDIIDGVPIDNL